MDEVIDGIVRHPWNTDFEWVDQSEPPTTLTADEVRQFDRDGYVVVPDLVDAPTLAAVTTEIDVHEAAVDAALRNVEGGRVMIAETGAITFAAHLAAKSTAAART